MPTYSYHCKNCDNGWDDFIAISKRNEPLEAPCPNCSNIGTIERVLDDSPKIVSGVSIRDKVPADYRTMHNRIKRSNIGSTMREI